MLATSVNTILIARASIGLSLGSQIPQTNFLQEGYWEALIRLLKLYKKEPLITILRIFKDKSRSSRP